MDTEKKMDEHVAVTQTKKSACVTCGRESCNGTHHHKNLDVSTGIKFGFGLGVGLACAFTLFVLFIAPLLSLLMAPLMYGGMMHRGFF
ncbi:MAG TPA: hypothetical protein VFV22_03345 [Candidatus Paceibacterota bacterium]|nr:hypothetical protein [Candidatus Paceibacterota bacterium]